MRQRAPGSTLSISSRNRPYGQNNQTSAGLLQSQKSISPSSERKTRPKVRPKDVTISRTSWLPSTVRPSRSRLSRPPIHSARLTTPASC